MVLNDIAWILQWYFNSNPIIFRITVSVTLPISFRKYLHFIGTIRIGNQIILIFIGQYDVWCLLPHKIFLYRLCMDFLYMMETEFDAYIITCWQASDLP